MNVLLICCIICGFAQARIHGNRELVHDTTNQDPCIHPCNKMPTGTYAITEMWKDHPNIHWRCTQPGKIALTFDDGPAANSLEVMRILDSNKVLGTFFVNGYRIDESTGPILTALEKHGHVIASHTFNHARMKITDSWSINQFIINEMEANEEAAAPYLEHGLTKIVRPPYLEMSSEMASKLQEIGYAVAEINIDTNDWMESATENSMFSAFTSVMADNTRYKVARNSYISLQHDPIEDTNKVIQATIDYAHELGYEFVTIDDCLGLPTRPPVTLSPTTSPVKNPTSSPTAPTTTNAPSPTPSLHPVYEISTCSGEPCDEKTKCRSAYGYCGIGADYCTDDCMWRIECEKKDEVIEEEEEGESDGLCFGAPCLSRDHCRDGNGECGSGAKYCNSLSVWSISCVKASNCLGDPCAQKDHCRSKFGFCGSGNQYCTSEMTWGPDCILLNTPDTPDDDNKTDIVNITSNALEMVQPVSMQWFYTLCITIALYFFN